jgi:hypothetical protein
MRFLLSAFVGLLATFASAAERPPKVLEPTSPWDLDYADNNCRLLRTFGADKDRVKLAFEQVSPRGPLTVILMGAVHAEGDGNVLAFDSVPGVEISGGQALDAVGSSDRIVFWPRSVGRGRWGLISEADAARMRSADPVAADRSPSIPPTLSPPHLSWKDHDWHVQSAEQWQGEDAAFSARAAQVTELVLNPGRYGSISLRSGSLAKPLQALEKCTADSLKDWGIDPAVESTVAIGAHPVEDPHRLFGSSDYPVEAMRAFKEDNLEVWLNIDAAGAITNCRVISDFASPEINDAICAMVRRKERFVPARTDDGIAVPDFYTENFVFKVQ